MGRSEVGIVIPAYNEGESIVGVINDMLLYGDVIVVDDGSSDSTAKFIKETAAFFILHESNRGYEAALTTGIEYASNQSYSYIITADADGELLATNLPHIISLLNDASLVVGIRNKKNRYIESLFGGITALFWRIRDPLCGMKGYKSSFYKRYNSFDTRKMIGTELLAKAIRDRQVVKQVSIDVKQREGESRYGNVLRSYLNITRAIFIFMWIALGKRS